MQTTNKPTNTAHTTSNTSAPGHEPCPSSSNTVFFPPRQSMRMALTTNTTGTQPRSCSLMSENPISTAKQDPPFLVDVLRPRNWDVIMKVTAHVLIPEVGGTLNPAKMETDVIRFPLLLPTFRRKTPKHIIDASMVVWQVNVLWRGSDTGVGTALHLGNGFWLTNAHVLQIPGPSCRFENTFRGIEVKRLSGDPPSLFSIGKSRSYKVKLVAVSEEYTSREGLVSWENDIELGSDFALLQITDEDRARCGTPTQHMIPAALTADEKQHPIDLYFLGINQGINPEVDTIISRTQSEKTIAQAVKKLKLGRISWKKGLGYAVDDHLEVGISTLAGSSGSMFLTERGAVALHSRGYSLLKFNNKTGRVEQIFTSECRGQAILWSTRPMQEFILKFFPRVFAGMQNAEGTLTMWLEAAEIVNSKA